MELPTEECEGHKAELKIQVEPEELVCFKSEMHEEVDQDCIPAVGMGGSNRLQGAAGVRQ